AEVELREIPLQMGLGAVLVDALHATLEHGEVAFNRVGVDGAGLEIGSAVQEVGFDQLADGAGGWLVEVRQRLKQRGIALVEASQWEQSLTPVDARLVEVPAVTQDHPARQVPTS